MSSLPQYDDHDQYLASLLPKVSFLKQVDPFDLPRIPAMKSCIVNAPDEEFSFLHEAAIISFHGVLYAAWYCNAELELHGRTPILMRRSFDHGVTWTQREILADDPTGTILYCPPVFGICDDRLYLLLNEMWKKPDHMHALDLYVLDESTGTFQFLWSRPLPFKLNTNVYTLPDGRLLLPGRIAQMDSFPNTPAVLISDSGKIDAEWRLVHIAPDGNLPDGSAYVHPELSAIVQEGRTWIFCRNDQRNVPIVYTSDDSCAHFSGPLTHDIPFSSSKIYSGTLSDGRNYVIGNTDRSRTRLALFVSEPGSMEFTRGYVLQDGPCPELGCGWMWHYPVACEADGNLYIICTINTDVGTIGRRRGAVLFTVPLSAI